jgi:hypothetical protein
MLKGSPGCLLVINENEINLRVSEDLRYPGTNEYTRRYLLRTKPLEFLTKEGECWAISF